MLIKVIVVDDSAFMRRVIISLLEEDPEIEVIGYARDGVDALKKISRLKPDVVTLDIEMPRMDGLETLQRLMADQPIPVIMLSAHTTAGARQTMEALELGAVDFVAKPEGGQGLELLQEELSHKIKVAARAKINKLSTSFLKSKQIKDEKPVIVSQPLKILAIGSSTGGPPALQAVLAQLPHNFPIGVVVAQHMPRGFTRHFASRLNEVCALEVKEAAKGDIIKSGKVLIAPAGYQMQFRRKGGTVTVDISEDSPIKTLYRPSVDVMFGSLADIYEGNCLAVILTGMGNDGTAGLKKMKERKATVLAQDKDSCVVYGMPKSAVEAGVVDKVVPLLDIGKTVIKLINGEISE